MLAALLPLLEAIGAEGGAAAALGGGAAETGLMGTLGRVLGGAKAFGSEKELGGAIRKISDLQASVEAAKEALADRQKQQADISQKARDEERQYAFSNPAHTTQLAELARQQQAHADEINRSQREMSQLRNRVTMTTDPAAARSANIGNAVGMIGMGSAIAAAAPSLIRNSSPVQITANMAQAGTNVAGNFMGQTQGAIAGQAAGFAGQTAGIANPISAAMHPLRTASELTVQLSKLPGLIQNWGEALVESQRNISRFSGVLSQSFAQADRRSLVRGIESGNRTGGATADLSSAMQDLADQIQPIKDTVTIGMARGLTVGVQLLGEGVKCLQAIWEVVKRMPIGKDVDKLLTEMEKGSRLDAEFRMRPLVAALKSIQTRDKSKPKDVPRR